MATPTRATPARSNETEWRDASTPRQKSKRVRTGCLTCRARKIKCDEKPGGCTNCEKRFLVCDYDTPGTQTEATEAPLPSPPVASYSCEQCRVARSRCTRAHPKCARCHTRNLSCAYRDDDGSGAGMARLTPTARQRIELARRRRNGHRKRPPQRAIFTSPGHQPSHGEDAELVTELVDETSDHTDTGVVWQPDSRQTEGGTVPSHAVPGEAQGSTPPPQAHDEPLPLDGNRYRQSPHPNVRQSANGEQGNKDQDQDVSDTVPENVHEYVNAFFEHVAPYQANAFLHRGMLGQQMRDNQASETLLLAICAISARFVDNTHHTTNTLPSTRSRTWARTAACRLLFAQNVTIDKAMAALLLCKNAAYSGDFNQAFLLAALANRFALKLHLFDETRWAHSVGNVGNADTDTAGSSWLAAEQRRRVMFACYSVDRATATGLAELTFCPATSLRLSLPSEDYNYDLDIPCTTPVPVLEADDLGSVNPSYESVGIMGHYVALVGIRYMILRYIESLSTFDTGNTGTSTVLPPWDPSSDYFLCLRKLAQWQRMLPARFRLTRAVLFSRHHTPHYHLGPLVMLHLWFDMLHCELYRLALQTHVEQPHLQALFQLAPPGWLDQTQNLCILHARQMVQTLQAVEDVTSSGGSSEHLDGSSPKSIGFTILDPSLSMLCYASAKIQLMHSTAARTPQSAIIDNVANSAERVEHFRVLLVFVERLARFYAPASFLLREIKNNLQQNGIVGPWSEPTAASAGTQTPDHPWFARLRGLDQPSPPSFFWGLEDVDLFGDVLHASDISLFNQVTGVPEWLR